ncbi:MAG: hypothetical protein MUO26_05465 [Methanotrichaceae archaeon]|nr:hypothetical protein [Methanotrichaceae archaeon]
MKSIALAVLLALTISSAQGVQLRGGNDNATAVLFGAVKALASEGENVTILELDMALLGGEDAGIELIDSKDMVYAPITFKNFEHGRTLAFFKVPEFALFKLLRIKPYSGEPFSINWWGTPKNSINDITLRYYGQVDSYIDPYKQAVAYQVSIFNSTSALPVALDNFRLIDQWGWPYTPTDIETFENGRINLIFNDTLSPLSKPAVLVYDYDGPNEIPIDLENDLKQLPDSEVYGTNATSSQSTEVKAPPAVAASNQTSQPKISTLKEDIAASKARLQNATGGSTSSSSPAPSSTTAGIEEARARLEAMKKNIRS